MYRIATTISMFILFLIFFSCKKYDAFGNEIKDYDEIKKASWLVGKWQNQTDSTQLVETWDFENDSTLIGTSYFIQNKKDTLHNESMALYEDKKLLIYSATIIGENNNEPVDFQKTIENENELIFENPKHDYPQKIGYRKINDTDLQISVSGKVKSKNEKSIYKLKKIAN